MGKKHSLKEDHFGPLTARKAVSACVNSSRGSALPVAADRRPYQAPQRRNGDSTEGNKPGSNPATHKLSGENLNAGYPFYLPNQIALYQTMSAAPDTCHRWFDDQCRIFENMLEIVQLYCHGSSSCFR